MSASGHDAGDARRLARIRRLARTLDSSIRLPGGYRVGLDGFLGLIPGAGDALGAALSTYIIVESARLGTSTWVLLRMMLNVLVETVIGVVPVLGDLFDFAWKANNRNIELLERTLPSADANPGGARRRLGTAAIGLLAAFVGVLVVVIVFAVWLLVRLVEAVGELQAV